MIINSCKRTSFAPESDKEAGTSSDQQESKDLEDKTSATET